MKMEQTECSETSAYEIQTPENYPEENIQHKAIIFGVEVNQVERFAFCIRKSQERGSLKHVLIDRRKKKKWDLGSNSGRHGP
jgi:hypothetical protein